MRTVIPIMMSIPLLLDLSACTTIPSTPKIEVYPITVISNIKCELQQAIWPNSAPSFSRERHKGNSWLKGWDVGINLNLKTVVSREAGGDVVVAIPSVGTGKFKLGIEGSRSQEKTNSQTWEFKQKLDKNFLGKSSACTHFVDKQRPGATLDGDLKIWEFFKTVRKSQKLINEKGSSNKGFAYSVKFTIKLNGGINPKFELIPIRGTSGKKTIGGGLNFSKNNKIEHTLTMGFAKRPPKKNDPLVVRVVNFPAPSKNKGLRSSRGTEKTVTTVTLPSSEPSSPTDRLIQNEILRNNLNN